MTKYLRTCAVVKETCKKFDAARLSGDMYDDALGCSSMCVVFCIFPVLFLSKYSKSWLVRTADGHAQSVHVVWVSV